MEDFDDKLWHTFTLQRDRRNTYYGVIHISGRMVVKIHDLARIDSLAQY
jgi:hypothetical protein